MVHKGGRMLHGDRMQCEHQSHVYVLYIYTLSKMLFKYVVDSVYNEHPYTPVSCTFRRWCFYNRSKSYVLHLVS